MKKKEKIILTATIATAVTFNIISLNAKNIEIREIKEENKKVLLEKNKELKEFKEKLDGANKSINVLENERNKIKENNEILEKENKRLREEISSTRNFELTYYTSLPQENGGYTTTATQTRLRHGVIASNHYPLGTKILIEGKVYTVEDRGGSDFNSPNRLDVLIERLPGESDSEYYDRVNDMGRKNVKGKIL